MRPIDEHSNGPDAFFQLHPTANALLLLLDQLSDTLAWIKDRNGIYRWVNRCFLTHYSLESLEQAKGRSDFDFSPEYIASKYRQDDECVLGGQEVFQRLELVGRFDHTAVWSYTNKVPLRDLSGHIFATAGSTTPRPDSLHTPALQDASISRVITHLHKHCGQRPSNVELAKVGHLSVRALERRFFSLLGESIQQYSRRLRLRLAIRELIFSKRSLAEIAELFGFSDQSHFAREFRRETHMTPSEYREKYSAAASITKIAATTQQASC